MLGVDWPRDAALCRRELLQRAVRECVIPPDVSYLASGVTHSRITVAAAFGAVRRVCMYA